MCAYIDSSGQLQIVGSQPFRLLVAGPELGLPAGQALPLECACPVNNLCNGVVGDERQAPTHGISLKLCCPPPPPTATPTNTRGEATATPTNTRAEATATPTNTRAEATATPTNTRVEATATPTNTRPAVTVTPVDPCLWPVPPVQVECVDIECAYPLIACEPPVGDSPELPCGSFVFYVFPRPNAVIDRCAPVPLNQPTLVKCEIPCLSVLRELDDATATIDPCRAITRVVKAKIMECINANGDDRLCAKLTPDGRLLLLGAVPFQVVIGGRELGAPYGYGLPVACGCPVNNLCNRIVGDERQPHTNGLAVSLCCPEATRTPTNTPPPQTRTPTPTRPQEPCRLNGEPVQRECIDLKCIDPLIACPRPWAATDEPCPNPVLYIVSGNVIGINPCGPIPLTGRVLAKCEIPCLTDLPYLEPGVAPIPPCMLVTRLIKARIHDCINANGDGVICARIGLNGELIIESTEPFQVFVGGRELGLPPDVVLPVECECPVTNLCNGILGDERRPHVSGLAVVRCCPPPPTRTPTWTPHAEPTRTPSNTPTRPPIHSPTPTNTLGVPCLLVGAPADRACLDIDCLEPLCLRPSNTQPCRPVVLMIVPKINDTAVNPCGPRPLPPNPLAACEIPCSTLGLVIEPAVVPPCEQLRRFIRTRLVACINAMGHGRVCAELIDGKIMITSVVPFDIMVTGPELGLPWNMGLPVQCQCPVNNLCNGVTGDERRPHEAGLAIRRCCDMVPTHTPTRPTDPTRTPTPVPTRDICELIQPPRVSAVVKICCDDPVPGGPAFTLNVIPRFYMPEVDELVPCRPVHHARTFGHCQIEMPMITVTCPHLAFGVTHQVAQCINNSRLGRRGLICARPIPNENAIRIDSVIPFLLGVSGGETGLPPGRNLLVLPECPVNNLFDGVNGNERLPHQQGMCLAIDYMVPPRPTPTRRCPCPPERAPGDMDGDGIPDALEAPNPPAADETNMVLADTDGDGLLDGEEGDDVFCGVNFRPRHRDSAGHGIWDGVSEHLLGGSEFLALLDPEDLVDADRDGLPALIDPDDNNPDMNNNRVRDGIDALRCGPAALLVNGLAPPVGDINCDGYVSNLDALMTQAHFLRLVPGTAGAFSNADMNRDGAISNLDGLVIQSFFLGLVQLLPL